MNPGYAVEERMRRQLRATKSLYDAIDFETKRVCFECKSAQLVALTKNGNHCRRRSDGSVRGNKMVITTRMGRFHIDLANHNMLKSLAESRGKIAKYVFCATLGKQAIKKVLSWEAVDALLDKSQQQCSLTIRQVWKEEIH